MRDGGFWSPQVELSLDVVGYCSVISLPLSHTAAESALALAAQPGAMKRLTGKLDDVRAARTRTTVNDLDRTLIVVESKELLEGQKRGIAARLVNVEELFRRAKRGGIAPWGPSFQHADGSLRLHTL